MRSHRTPASDRRHARGVAVAAAAFLVTTALTTAPAAGAPARRAAAPAGGRVQVRFAKGADRAARSEALATVHGVRIGTIYGESVAVVRVPSGVAAPAAAATLRSSPGVAWAAPDGMARVTAAPDDPDFPQQYALKNAGQTGGLVDADIDAPEGWTAAGLSGSWPTTGGTPIGFVDTGIDTTHPEFPGTRLAGCWHSSGGVVSTECKDGNGHGTHVAGIAAAATNNGTGVAGVSFDSPIEVCRAFGSDGTAFNSDVAACINWLADHGAKILNMSFTTDPGTEGEIRPAVTAAADSGLLLVAAAGNTGNTAVQYPAGFSEVVSVGNTTASDTIEPHSTHDADVELSAPGTAILSTWKGGGYQTLTGTSMASPVVVGVAAITWQLHPAETAVEIRARIDAAVDDLGAPGRDPYFGFGRINLCLAAGGSCTYAPQSNAPGAIAGTVTSTAGKPLKARVVVVSGPTRAKTRSNRATGAYSLKGLSPGSYSVRAKRKGCQRLTKPAPVQANATTTLDFALTCS